MNLIANFFARIKDYIFPKAVIEREFNASPAVSSIMEQNIALWYSMYINNPPWASDKVRPIGIPAAIAREVSRAALVELNVNFSGGQKAEYLEKIFSDARKHFLRDLEIGLSLGGIAFKPYIDGDEVRVDATGLSAFEPTKFDAGGRCIGGVFKSNPEKVGENYYVKLESHEFDNGVYVVKNKAYASDEGGAVRQSVPLSTVHAWADIQDEVRIGHLTGPLFAYFKVPNANNIDTSSNVGISIYSGAAAELIRQADEQWAMLAWEYLSGKRKIYMDGTQAQAAHFDRDLFEIGMFGSSGEFFHEFNPVFRDDPIYRGFQNILKQIEFQVGLSYGTISDPNRVEKTATEIRNSKQRMYVTVDSIQNALESAFDSLIYAIDALSSLMGLAPVGDYEVTYDWGDSILNDADTKRVELESMRADVAAGIIRPELYVAKKYNVSEEEAVQMMPQMAQLISSGGVPTAGEERE